MVPQIGEIDNLRENSSDGEEVPTDHIIKSKKNVGRIINQVIVGLGASGTVWQASVMEREYRLRLRDANAPKASSSTGGTEPAQITPSPGPGTGQRSPWESS